MIKTGNAISGMKYICININHKIFLIIGDNKIIKTRRPGLIFGTAGKKFLNSVFLDENHIL